MKNNQSHRRHIKRVWLVRIPMEIELLWRKLLRQTSVLNLVHANLRLAAEKLPQKSEMVAPSNHPRNFVFMVGTAVLRHIIKITSSYKIMECATWQVSLFIKESYCEKYLYILMIIYIYIYILMIIYIYIYIFT